MKLMTPLYKDPVGWSNSLAKTKLRVVLFGIMHVVVITMGLYMVHNGILTSQEISGTSGISEISFTDTLSSGAIIFFVGAAYPIMYLYAMYKLLKMIPKEEDKTS